MSRKPRVSAAMVSLMGGGERHAWTLDELHSALVERGHPTDFSSVFRAAEKLAAAGIVRKLLLDDGRARFELSSAHHDHLYCTRCHQLVPVRCPSFRAPVPTCLRPAQRTRFAHGHRAAHAVSSAAPST